MYHISKPSAQPGNKRFVLLEQLPVLLSSRILLLVFLYTMAFTFLLAGLRMLQPRTVSQSTSVIAIASPLQMQQDIAAQVIRFHVIANSDTAADQNLKLTVRDGVIRSLQDTLRSADSIEDARRAIRAQLPQIRTTARRILLEQGCDAPVNVLLTKRNFPVKTYGDLTFPAGEYEALCIEIGEARGHNWWCVLYPSLCFINETHAIVPDTSKQKLKKNLTTQEYALLESHTSRTTLSARRTTAKKNAAFGAKCATAKKNSPSAIKATKAKKNNPSAVNAIKKRNTSASGKRKTIASAAKKQKKNAATPKVIWRSGIMDRLCGH